MWWSAKHHLGIITGKKVPYTTSVICSFLANASFSSRRSLWRRLAARGGMSHAALQ
jgi:hypothetical protein